MLDSELNIVWANAIATGAFGKDIIGRKCYEAYHGRSEPCEPYPCLVLKTFKDGKTYEHDTEVVDKEGNTIYFHCTSNVASRDKDNQPVTVLEISRDITVGKKAEEALRESHQQFQGLVETLYDWVWEVDRQGRYTYVSPQIKHILGYDREEILGKRAYDLMSPEDAKGLPGIVGILIKEGKPIVALQNINIHKDGHPVVLETNGLPFYDAAGNLKGYRGTDRDITGRRKMEEELKVHRDQLEQLVAIRTAEMEEEVAIRKAKELQYLSLVESMVEWVWETDANFVLTYISSRIHDVLGYRPEELVGRSPADIMPPEGAARAMPLIGRVFSQKGSFKSFETVHIHKDGRLIFVEANGTPCFDKNGRLLGYRGSCHDITERKQFIDAIIEREQDLTTKSKNLEDINAALRVLLNQREEDRRELEGKFVANVRQMVLPYMQKISKSSLDSPCRTYLDIAMSNLNEIVSPFLNSIQQMNFTPREIEVASLIKEGKTTKEIAEIMGVAQSAVCSHRDNIRKKLNLNNKKANLRSHLMSLK